MKLTINQVSERMSLAWGRQAFVVPFRLAGNRYSYVATDHKDHWLPLRTSWDGGRQMFEPVGSPWPEREHDPWSDAVLDATQVAMAYFAERGDSEAIKRLPRGQVIADRYNWRRVGCTILGSESV